MARKCALNLRCPICKEPAKNEGSDFPFCSERCRLIDLGKWASGAYVVSSRLQDSAEDELSSDSERSDEE